MFPFLKGFVYTGILVCQLNKKIQCFFLDCIRSRRATPLCPRVTEATVLFFEGVRGTFDPKGEPCPRTGIFKGGMTPQRHSLGCEYSLFGHFSLESREGALNEAATQDFFIFRCKGGIAQRMRDGHCGNDSVRAHTQGDGNDGRHVDDRNISSFFNGLGERCTATRTGSSGGCEDNRLHSGIAEALTDFEAEFFRIGDGSTVTNSGVEQVMQ